MTYLLPKISWKPISFSWQPKWFETEKERINKVLIGSICFKIKNTAQPAKRNIFIKIGNKVKDVGDSRKRNRARGQR